MYALLYTANLKLKNIGKSKKKKIPIDSLMIKEKAVHIFNMLRAGFIS